LQDELTHWGDGDFEDFVEEELSALAERAQARGICIDCLGDRLIFEVVIGLVRSGATEQDIHSIVDEALAEADAEDTDQDRPPPRIH
jgi:hypothetical protein